MSLLSISSVCPVSTTESSQQLRAQVPLAEVIEGCAHRSEVTGISFTNRGTEPVDFCIDSLSLL